MNFGSHTSLVINGLVGKENESALAHLLTIVNFFDRLVMGSTHGMQVILSLTFTMVIFALSFPEIAGQTISSSGFITGEFYIFIILKFYLK